MAIHGERLLLPSASSWDLGVAVAAGSVHGV